MRAGDTGDITRLLRRHRAGDREAFDTLVGLVYQHLRLLARRQIARGWRSRTFDTTTLVHESYLRLLRDGAVEWQDREHFFAIASATMRRVLVDYARYRGAHKRGGTLRAVDLDDDTLTVDGQLALVLAVDQALERLQGVNKRLARVVECRYFAGLSEEETATALGTSLRTVQRDWTRARAWLLQELS